MRALRPAVDVYHSQLKRRVPRSLLELRRRRDQAYQLPRTDGVRLPRRLASNFQPTTPTELDCDRTTPSEWAQHATCQRAPTVHRLVRRLSGGHMHAVLESPPGEQWLSRRSVLLRAGLVPGSSWSTLWYHSRVRRLSRPSPATLAALAAAKHRVSRHVAAAVATAATAAAVATAAGAAAAATAAIAAPVAIAGGRRCTMRTSRQPDWLVLNLVARRCGWLGDVPRLHERCRLP